MGLKGTGLVNTTAGPHPSTHCGTARRRYPTALERTTGDKGLRAGELRRLATAQHYRHCVLDMRGCKDGKGANYNYGDAMGLHGCAAVPPLGRLAHSLGVERCQQASQL